MSAAEHIEYEIAGTGIARIWLSRPEARNAQDTALLYALNDAFDRAMADDDVKVIVLAARGPHFSAGHDLSEPDPGAALAARQTVGTWTGGTASGADGNYVREKEIYEGFCRRWRDLCKPTIVAVQGKAIAGGLMLIWPMDFVIASDDASFQDNTIDMGIPGVEYFAHAWELGIRGAKEFLLAGQPMDARQALQAGMVNRVVPREELQEATLEFAAMLAAKPAFALKLAKDAINAAFSAQGFDNVQRAAFNAHQLAHSHYRLSQDGAYIDREFMARFSGSRQRDPKT